MPHPARTAGGHRLYGEDLVKRLGFIRRSRQLSFALEQIRTPLRRVDGTRHTCAQVKRITLEHLDDVRRKVADLRKIDRVLTDMAGQCDGGTVPRCPVIDGVRSGARLAQPRGHQVTPTRGSPSRSSYALTITP